MPSHVRQASVTNVRPSHTLLPTKAGTTRKKSLMRPTNAEESLKFALRKLTVFDPHCIYGASVGRLAFCCSVIISLFTLDVAPFVCWSRCYWSVLTRPCRHPPQSLRTWRGRTILMYWSTITRVLLCFCSLLYICWPPFFLTGPSRYTGIFLEPWEPLSPRFLRS